jgi:hypothetical protein
MPSRTTERAPFLGAFLFYIRFKCTQVKVRIRKYLQGIAFSMLISKVLTKVILDFVKNLYMLGLICIENGIFLYIRKSLN